MIVRLLMLPLTIKQIKSMNALRALQPQIKEIQEKYKDDTQRQQQEMMKFYQENKVNPLALVPAAAAPAPGLHRAVLAAAAAPSSRTSSQGSSQPGWLFIDNLAEKATGAVLVVLIVLYVAVAARLERGDGGRADEPASRSS